ncbi:MAG: glycosyltransferase [Pseudomonadota bacterium]
MTASPLPLKQRVLGSAQRAWRTLPEPARHRFWTALRPTIEFYRFQSLARPSDIVPKRQDAPLVVAGLFSTASGLGEGARSTWRSLKAAGLSPLAVDLSDKFAPVDYQPEMPLHSMPDDVDGTLILQMNAPETPAALRHLSMKRGRSWYTIGYWAWELPTFPTGWERPFPLLSEIWAISTFTAGAFQREDAPPISVFGHAISPPETITPSCQKFGQRYGLPEDAFVFLATADSMSSVERKNPMAAIAAHRAAFGDDPSAILLVKTRNLDRAPKAKVHLESATAGYQNIRLIDESLSEAARWELLDAVDAVVALHRSEGFGLVIAEAMAIGKPVITTDWSGNMDFCDEDTVWLVPSRLIDVHDPYGVYRVKHSQWADADTQHAAECLKVVRDDAFQRAQKTVKARDRIAHLASPESLGKSMRKHLFDGT